MKHKLGYFLFTLCVLWGVLGIGELNNLLAHRLDFTPDAPIIEVFSFLTWHWYLPEGAWYNTVLWGMIGGSFLGLILIFWFWQE